MRCFEAGSLKTIVLSLGLVAMQSACSNPREDASDHHDGGPAGPTVLPSPTPSPTPAPSPKPSPSASGITLQLRYFGAQECKRGAGPTGTTDLRVHCGVEVRATAKSADGLDVPQRRTGGEVVWRVVEGASSITLPWDENPWKRWITGVQPGHYRIVATLTLPEGDTVAGEIEGNIIP